MMNMAAVVSALHEVRCEVATDARCQISLAWDTCSRDRMDRALCLGEGATVLYFTDRRAATIVAIERRGRRVTVRMDRAKLLNAPGPGEVDALDALNGYSGTQRYEYQPSPRGEQMVFSRRVHRGRVVWIRVGDPVNGGLRLSIGHRSHHYDYNF